MCSDTVYSTTFRKRQKSNVRFHLCMHASLRQDYINDHQTFLDHIWGVTQWNTIRSMNIYNHL